MLSYFVHHEAGMPKDSMLVFHKPFHRSIVRGHFAQDIDAHIGAHMAGIQPNLPRVRKLGGFGFGSKPQ